DGLTVDFVVESDRAQLSEIVQRVRDGRLRTQRFHSSSAALVNSKTGCLKYRILEPVDASAPEVVFESIWSDLDAVKVAFGDAWQQSYLPEGYSALMTAYSVHHFFVSESSKIK